MPALNFRPVLRTRYFRDTFYLITVDRVVGEDGLEVDQRSYPKKIRGIVVPGRMSNIRTADGSRVEAFIEIYTEVRLSAGSKKDDVSSRDGDHIMWHGRTYLVMAVEDYSAFARGFIKASCDLITLATPELT